MIDTMKIKFNVNKQQLQRQDDEIIASFSKNLLQCEFNFDDTWIDIYKYALFTDTSNNQTIVKLGIEQYVSCMVPENMLQSNYFLVSVFGGDRLTTTQETVLVQSSGFSKTLENQIENGLVDVTSSSNTALDYFKTYKSLCRHRRYRRNKFEEQEHPYFE